MKKLLIIAAGSLALVAGTASAGGGCIYGKHADLASAVDAEGNETRIIDDSTDPKLLALLKKQEAEKVAEEFAAN